MRQSWMVGRAVPCPPHGGGAMLVPLPMPDGGQGTARPTFLPAITDTLRNRVSARLETRPAENRKKLTDNPVFFV